jgi:hypothetical protein
VKICMEQLVKKVCICDDCHFQEEDDEEEEEPQLKYQRLGNSVPDILKRESASAVHVHEKFVALGYVNQHASIAVCLYACTTLLSRC